MTNEEIGVFLRTFANSPDWGELKSILIEYIKVISDVSNNFGLNRDVLQGITAGEKYAGKVIASETLKELIDDIDRFKNGKGNIEKIDWE